MFSEPGLFPTLYLRILLSQRAAAPGDRLSLRIDGTDAGSLIRGKILGLEHEHDNDWDYVGIVVAAPSVDVPSRWKPTGRTGAFAVTAEGYPATRPLYFEVPLLDPGEYRIRLDAIHRNHDIGDLRARTATLYAPLRVLPPR